MKGRKTDVLWWYSNHSPNRVVKHFKGRRYVVYRDPYGAAAAALKAWDNYVATRQVHVLAKAGPGRSVAVDIHVTYDRKALLATVAPTEAETAAARSFFEQQLRYRK